ncbi:MAG: signal peptidase II [Deltaproteobacteria bacterium]|nr:signal peptidase II [Deltaproteobacteria bacterium]
MPRRYKLFILIGFVILALDQITKYWARAALAKYGYAGFPVIDGYWIMRLSFNTGSAFGLFNRPDWAPWARVFLSVVGIGAFAAIIMILRRAHDSQKWVTTALGLIAGGAVGNVIDRIFAGKVTDFIVWKYNVHEWPAFNIADSALCVGVAIMFLDIGREQKKAKVTQPTSSAS